MYSFNRLIAPTAVLVFATFVAGAAYADATVSVCGVDVALGPGTNLQEALAIGGRITFTCSDRHIKMTSQHVLTRSVDIDGTGGYILDGNHAVGILQANSPQVEITLRNLHIQGAQNNTLGSVVSAKAGSVRLQNVLTEDSDAPYYVDTLTASGGSVFDDNRGKVITARTVELTDVSLTRNNGSPLSQMNGTSGTARLTNVEVDDNSDNIVWHSGIEIHKSSFTSNQGVYGGALSLSGSVLITDSHFASNRATDGGAIDVADGLAIIRSTTFETNQALQAGGAISAHGFGNKLALKLDYVKFRRNKAGDNGGALVFAGDGSTRENELTGSGVLFTANTAGTVGGGVDVNIDKVQFARAIFVDNQAASSGGAIFINTIGKTELGNAILAGNKAKSGGGIFGTNFSLTNVTIARNSGGGIVVLQPQQPSPSAAQSTMANVIVAANDPFNCSVPATEKLTDAGHNLQFPSTSCGSTLSVQDPLLDSLYVPMLGSPARFAGDQKVCLEHPLVHGRDALSAPRPVHNACAIGAVEHPPENRAIGILRKSEGLPATVKTFLTLLGF
ncbi:hypothetical protein [Bradyrhizobium sp. LB11.1]|uniref:hypothetical protein n=1 Tax=Bradyrhizobium sp. LB11.1 TaxID=3156326 RepID=UPI00339AB6D3